MSALDSLSLLLPAPIPLTVTRHGENNNKSENYKSVSSSQY